MDRLIQLDMTRECNGRKAADFIGLGACLLFIATSVLEGPLRYWLASMGAGTALYVRDAVGWAAISMYLLAWIRGMGSEFKLVIVLMILVCHLAVGFWVQTSPYQAMLGLKTFAWFLLGFCVSDALVVRQRSLYQVVGVVFLVTVFGVFLNSFVSFPWIGLSYDTAFGTVNASKLWWSAGVQRLPGFTRASYDAAITTLVALVVVLSAGVSRFTKIIAMMTAAGCVWLTTSKSGYLTLASLMVWRLIEGGLRSVRLSLVLCWALFVACIALPVVALTNVTGNPPKVPQWLLSMFERAALGWPQALETMIREGSWLTGRGLGGIGVAQYIAELTKANPADNLVIYMVSVFGVLGIVYLAAYLVKVSQISLARGSTDWYSQIIRGWTIVWFSYGCAANMIEDGIMSLAIGVAWGLVFGSWSREGLSPARS